MTATWVGTTAAGLIRLTAGVTSSFTAADRLSDDKILSLYEDPEGSLWVGTAAGLDRFRKTKLTTFTRKEGLPADQTSLAVETRDGSVYVLCPGGGLARIKNGVVTALTARDGLPDLYGNGPPPLVWTVSERPSSRLSPEKRASPPIRLAWPWKPEMAASMCFAPAADWRASRTA